MPLGDIETIVFAMLENRSFDHMLGYLGTGANKLAVEGLRDDPAWLAAHANAFAGKRYPPHALGSADVSADPPHDHVAIAQQIGPGLAMNGFVASYVARSTAPPPDPGAVMGYYTADQVPTFDFFARNYAVCDHWFASLPTGTQPNRLMAMSGSSSILDNASVLLPDQYLVYDWLTDKQVSWCTYQWGDFLPFFSLNKRYLPEIMTSLTLSALGGRGRFRRYSRLREHWLGDGPMPSVMFVEPEYTDGPHAVANDDHPPTGIARGQAFLADLYDTLTANPDRWRNTMLIVTYDEHGGFYDHVKPLPISAVAGGTALATTGVRVPAFVVSPHVAPGLPFTDRLDHTSFLQLLADRFTPGQPYSAAVSARQASLGRLSTVLTEVPGPPLARPAAARAAMAAPTVSGPLSPGANQTVEAFATAARKATTDHPELAAGPGWGNLERAPAG